MDDEGDHDDDPPCHDNYHREAISCAPSAAAAMTVSVASSAGHAA